MHAASQHFNIQNRLLPQRGVTQEHASFCNLNNVKKQGQVTVGRRKLILCQHLILWEKSRGNGALIGLFFAGLFTSLLQRVPMPHSLMVTNNTGILTQEAQWQL